MSGPRKNGNKGQQRTRASSWVGFAFASTQYFRHICLGARTFCYIEKAARNCAKMLILSFFFFFLCGLLPFAGAKNGKNAPLLFLLLICF